VILFKKFTINACNNIDSKDIKTKLNASPLD